MNGKFSWNAEKNSCDIGKITIDRVVDLESVPFAANIIYPEVTESDLPILAKTIGAHHFDPSSLDLLLSFHAFLVRTDKHTILVDLCCGNDKQRPTRQAWHQRSGPFLENLQKTGVGVEDIDFVMCTHLHADHVGWNTRLINGDWVPTFPNAQYLFAEKEFTHWKTIHETHPPEPILYGAYRDSILPVIESEQATLVNSDHAVGPSVHMEAAYGHTPGNVIIHVEEDASHAILCGDAIHHPVQLVHPKWSTNFCTNPDESRITRMALLEDYADTPTAILPAHFEAPNYGPIVRDGDHYFFANT